MMVRLDFPWWLPGAALMTFGLMVAVFPELLALLVAAAFMFVGMSSLAAGWSARRFRQDMRSVRSRDQYHWFV